MTSDLGRQQRTDQLDGGYTIAAAQPTRDTAEGSSAAGSIDLVDGR